MKQSRLSKLAKITGTDKGPDLHDYTYWYEKWFSGYDNPSILEIGVLDGASIRMYDKFWDGECRICCTDIDDKSALFENMSNVSFFRFDQGDRLQWDKFLSDTSGRKYDIIIEDGGHRYDQQLVTLSKLWPYVNPGGIYILEDLHTSYDKHFMPDAYYNAFDGFDGTPLAFLNFLGFRRNPMLTENEQAELVAHIKNIVILNLRSQNTWFKNRSVTAIITFI